MTTSVETGFKTFRPHRGINATDYQPPRLFTEFGRYGADHRKWEYVRDELVKMAEAGTLFLTDCLLQPGRIAGTVADVVMGVAIQDHNQVRRQTPAILQTYQVRVRSVTGETVKWEQDIARGDLLRKGASEGLDMVDAGDAPMAAYRAEPEWVDTGATEAMLTLPQALLCLKAAGKYVRRAKSSRLQASQWKYEEVRPEGEAKPEEPAPKAKRSFAEANKG